MEAAQTYSAITIRGSGRYEPAQAYQRGSPFYACCRTLIGETGFLFGANPTSPDAGIYVFIANIYFYDIEMPLRAFVASQPNFVRHCKAIHAAVSGIT